MTAFHDLDSMSDEDWDKVCPPPSVPAVANCLVLGDKREEQSLSLQGGPADLQRQPGRRFFHHHFVHCGTD